MRSNFTSVLTALLLLTLCHCTVQAAQVIEHEGGQLTLLSPPTRIVVLEYSFIDALAAIGVSPVGVADDKKPQRIIAPVRALIKPWASVGMRSQPNLEVISQLKPDLIIADVYRHRVSYQDLSSIAPTILLKSRGEDYQGTLAAAKIIGKALGKENLMQARIDQHTNLMAAYRDKFSQVATIQYASVNDRGMWMHGPRSYTGSLLTYLGLNSAIPDLQASHILETNLELLLKVDPQWLFYSKRKPITVLDSWKKSPLFNFLSISKTQQAVHVSPELWALSRGMLAAEGIAQDLDKHLNSTKLIQ